MANFIQLMEKVRQCTLCQDKLPLAAKPILQASERAQILIAGQAPGRKAHASGIPFDDASGNRLKQWLGLTDKQFYDANLVAILPMGFCYPGTGKSGDLAPRPECAPTWRQTLLDAMPNVQLTLVIGQYAIKWYMPADNGTVTAAVEHSLSQIEAADYSEIVLPHPSPRNNIWLRKNAWFEQKMLPLLQQRVAQIVANKPN